MGLVNPVKKPGQMERGIEFLLEIPNRHLVFDKIDITDNRFCKHSFSFPEAMQSPEQNSVKGRPRLPVQAASDFEDSKDRDVARERTRPERQNGNWEFGL